MELDQAHVELEEASHVLACTDAHTRAHTHGGRREGGRRRGREKDMHIYIVCSAMSNVLLCTTQIYAHSSRSKFETRGLFEITGGMSLKLPYISFNKGGHLDGAP